MRRLTVCCLACVMVVCAAGTGAAQDVGFARSRAKDMLQQVSSTVEKNFYDPKMKGLDWKALTEEAKAKIEAAKTLGEMDAVIYTLVNRLQDSHTRYFPPYKTNTPRFGFEAKAFGDEIRVSRLKKDGAAEAAGLKLGDRIYGISGIRAERDTIDLLMLTVTVYRPQGALTLLTSRGNEEPHPVRVDAKFKTDQAVVDFTRLDNIYDYIREVQGDLKEENMDRFPYANLEGGIGYLKLPTFSVEPSFLIDFAGKVKDSKAVIVDLRGNGGGYVDSLTAFAGVFEKELTVIGDEAGRKKTEPMKVKPQKPGLTVPLFILIDSETASASEIFARHFQRTGRATVIGDRSSAKVTGARFYTLGVGQDTEVLAGVQVAGFRLVLPGGEEIEGKGVAPDQPCIPKQEEMREGLDPCRVLAIRLAQKALGLPDKPIDIQEKVKKDIYY